METAAETPAADPEPEQRPQDEDERAALLAEELREAIRRKLAPAAD